MNKKVILLSGFLALVSQFALPSSSSSSSSDEDLYTQVLQQEALPVSGSSSFDLHPQSIVASRYSIVGQLFREFKYDPKAECFPHPIYFREQIKKVDDINICGNSLGQTLLHIIAIDGRVIQLRELVTHPNLDPNRQDIYGNTALHYAAQNDDFEVAEFLLKLPTTSLSILNLDGKTPEYYVTSQKILRIMANHKAGLPLMSRKLLTPSSSVAPKKPAAKSRKRAVSAASKAPKKPAAKRGRGR